MEKGGSIRPSYSMQEFKAILKSTVAGGGGGVSSDQKASR